MWFEEKDIEYHINPLFFWELENIGRKNGFKLETVKGNSEYFFSNLSQKSSLRASESLVFIFKKFYQSGS